MFVSANAQAFQEVVFVHKVKKSERTFKKGQKLKVISQNPKGVSFEYLGRLTEITPDTIFLDMKVGEIGLPLSSVTKIQRRGIQPLGIAFIVVGLLALFVGAALNVWDEVVDLLTSPVGIEQKKHPGTPMLIFGGAIFLAGLFFFRYPPVNYPKQEWELHTDAPQLKQNIP
jgi:hypothetical protein